MTIRYELTPLRKDGTYGVRILITNGAGANNRMRIPTNLSVPKKDVKGKAIKNLAVLDQINSFLIECRKRYAGDTILEEKKKSTQEIANIILDKNAALPTFFQFADAFISSLDLKGKKNYVCAINSFKRFARGVDFKFKDISPELLALYENSIEGERAKSLYLSTIRHLWNKADIQYEELMPKSPFRRYHVPKQKPKGKRAVDISVIKTIYNYKGTGVRANMARDCFLLSFCMMGMNAADLFTCSVLENNTIKYDREKTKDRRVDNAHQEVVIVPFIKDLVEKYRDPSGKRVFNFYLRYTQEADFVRALNIGLKAILGATTKVTFYAARHSWATIARNNIKANKYDVNEALIHVDKAMDVTDIYIMKDYSIVNELNAKVVDYVFNEKGQSCE